jgi:7-cyano-7-deazaguanine synthase
MRIVALASGGIDSSVMMFLLKKDGHELMPLFIDYGQLAREKEWIAVKKISQHFSLNPQKMDISGFGDTIPSGITNKKLDIERDAFLPTRNLLFLTVGAAYGYSKSVGVIAIGLLSSHIFPDQTEEFIQTAQQCLSSCLGIEINILAPLIALDKIDVLKLAQKYELPVGLTYSCHTGNDKPCGQCISCREIMTAERQLMKKEEK